MILLLPKLFYPQFIKFSASDVSIIAEVTPSNFRHLDENLMKRERERPCQRFLDVSKPLLYYSSVTPLIIIGEDHLLFASDTIMSGIGRASH